MNRFLHFCEGQGATPFPVSETLLCYFVAALARQGLALSTIRTYLAEVRHAQIMRGLPEPRQQSSLPRLRLVQTGVQRDRVERGCNTARVRLPITPTLLRRVRVVWNSQALDPDIVMLWAAATTCFFGFFRAGEITVPSRAAYNPHVHLSWGDVAADSRGSPSMIRVHLKQSKCDQLGRGADVFIGRTADDICPVAAVMAYMARRGGASGPFFRFRDGFPLTKARFVARFRSALSQAGVPYQDYSGHSFRIGAAMAAAQAGVEDSTIQSLGRWSNQAFLTYIQIPKEQLAPIARILSRGTIH